MFLTTVRSFSVVLLGGLLLVSGLVADAAAQPKLYPRVEVMGAGGALFPLNEFKDNADSGYLYSLQAGWRVAKASTIGLSFTRSVTSATDKFREDNNVAAGSTAEFALWYWSVYYKQVAFEATFRPYIRIHMGAIDVDPNVDGTEVQDVKVKFAMAGGFGLQWKDRWPVGVYTELMYHQAILQENDPLTQSDRRQFLTLRFGLSYDFL